MHGIYNYIPETSHVSRVHNVAAVLYLQSVLHVKLFRPWNMFCTLTLALSAVCMQCQVWQFFGSSLISCFPCMLFRYCLSDFEMVPALLWPVSLLRSHSTCAEQLLWGIYTENLLDFFLDHISVSRNSLLLLLLLLLLYFSSLCRIFTII